MIHRPRKVRNRGRDEGTNGSPWEREIENILWVDSFKGSCREDRENGLEGRNELRDSWN